MTELSKCEKETIATIYGMEYDPALEDVRSAVNAQYHHEWKPQTVSTFLSRMVKKGWLEFYRKGRYCYYKTLLSKKEYDKYIWDETLAIVFNGDIDKFNQSALNEILTTSFNGDVDKFKDFMMEFCQNAASIKSERN